MAKKKKTPLREVVERSAAICLAVQNTFNPFLPICSRLKMLLLGVASGTKFEGNRSSPLYAICLNWITFLQFVGFDSKLFYGRHCQIEPDGEHPTSIERNSSSHLSMRPPNPRFVHPYLTAYSSDAVSYKQFAGIGFTPLYATLTRLEPLFNTTARSLHRGAATF